MTTRFKILNTFVLSTRKLFVLEGRITRGKIREGMDLRYTDGRGRMALLPVEATEFSLHKENGAAIEMVCLCLRYDDEEMLAAFRSLKLKNRSFVVSQPAIKTRHRAVYRISFTPSYVRESRVGYGKVSKRLPELEPGEVLTTVSDSGDDEQVVVYEGRRNSSEGKFRTLDGKRINAGKAKMIRSARIGKPKGQR